MRAALSAALVKLAKADSNILLLTGDHGYALFDDFRSECPNQYINAGIAEQNMVGMAAGLARSGYRPVVYGLSAFIPLRVVEQIKLDVAHDMLPVTFIGDGAGFVYSQLGTSHQATEDIACTRAIPNISVLSPSDRFELHACIEFCYRAKTPCYLRIGKADRGDIHTEVPNLVPGNLFKVRQGHGSDVTFIATGAMVTTAVRLADSKFTGATVWSAPFIKPLNCSQVIQICKSNKIIVVIEEHSIFGGLGSAVAEISSEHFPTRVLRIGVRDRFSHSCGSYDYLLKEHGLNQEAVELQINQFMGLHRLCV